ncbi:MAG: SGNH/GDSL hydrolase family protein, partial [Chloroflexi bacterium]|nr:SGNH/GDSL hydrolase family protein [Chloroflexota bacterium]
MSAVRESIALAEAGIAQRLIRRSARGLLIVLWLMFVVIVTAALLGAVELGLRIRREVIAAHLPVPPNTDDRLVADRLLRFKNRPSYSYADGEARYTNNQLGLRGPEIAVQKPAGTKRVVIVGASTVYGATDDDSQTISVQLEALLRQQLGKNIQVINGGVPGYDSLRELVLTRSYLLALQPDVVIDLDGLNDVYYGSNEDWPSQIAADELGIIADGRYPEIVRMVDATMFPRGLIEHQVLSLTRDLRPYWYGLIRQSVPAAPRVASDRVVAMHAQAMGLMAEYGHERGISVIAALQPLVATGHKQLTLQEQAAVGRGEYWDVNNWAGTALQMYPSMASTTREAVTTNGGTFLDLTGVFDDERLTTYAGDAVHYNGVGNLRLAQALAPLI